MTTFYGIPLEQLDFDGLNREIRENLVGGHYLIYRDNSNRVRWQICCIDNKLKLLAGGLSFAKRVTLSEPVSIDGVKSIAQYIKDFSDF